MAENVWIGLGSNLGDSKAILTRAFEQLDSLPRTKLAAKSAVITTKAWGKTRQPDFFNAAARLVTALSPFELLKECQKIENREGRIRREKWGARTLDLDILLFGSQIINTPELIVPHKFLTRRMFVLQSLSELDPNLVIPGTGRQVRDFMQTP